MSGKIPITLTPSQLRMVNEGLAMLEAAGGEDNPDYRQTVMDRTRKIVWDALDRNKVKP